MTPRTSEQERLRRTVTGNGASSPWTDVISLEVALRGEDDGLQEGIEKLANDTAEEVGLLSRIAERWAREWDVTDPRLSRAIEKDSSLYDTAPFVSKIFAMQEGIRNALLEAEERGVTRVIEPEGASDTWWFADLKQENLERALTVVGEARDKRTENGGEDTPSHLPEKRDYTGRLQALEETAASTSLAGSPSSGANLRAYLFASWIRARATAHAEKELLSILYEYPDDYFASATLSDRIGCKFIESGLINTDWIDELRGKGSPDEPTILEEMEDQDMQIRA